MCETAKVKPLYKIDNSTEPENYKPVSLLPIFLNIIERVLCNQPIKHLEKHDILHEYQSGFRSKHPVNTCLDHFPNHILKGFRSGKSTEMINLEKAFKSNRLVWFLLKKAKHCCKPCENSFGNRNFELWCPSRINIRPYTILIICKLDEDSTEECDLYLYADDACILYSHQNVNFFEINLNHDFNNLCEWLIDNKLSIHFGEDKTKSILCKRGSKSNFSLKITRNENV